MSKASVVPIAHYRLPGGRYRIEIGEALTDFPTRDDLADATKVNQTIEHYIKKCPSNTFGCTAVLNIKLMDQTHTTKTKPLRRSEPTKIWLIVAG